MRLTVETETKEVMATGGKAGGWKEKKQKQAGNYYDHV